MDAPRPSHRARRAIAGAVVATLAAVGLALVPSAAVAAAPADDEEQLPATGSDSAPILAATGLMLLLLGAGVLITRRRIRA